MRWTLAHKLAIRQLQGNPPENLRKDDQEFPYKNHIDYWQCITIDSYRLCARVRFVWCFALHPELWHSMSAAMFWAWPLSFWLSAGWLHRCTPWIITWVSSTLKSMINDGQQIPQMRAAHCTLRGIDGNKHDNTTILAWSHFLINIVLPCTVCHWSCILVFMFCPCASVAADA